MLTIHISWQKAINKPGNSRLLGPKESKLSVHCTLPAGQDQVDGNRTLRKNIHQPM